MASRNIVLKIIFNMTKNGSAVTFSCLYYKRNEISQISKWEEKMGITSGNRSRHTKHYYGNSKLEQLLLVFLGNQEATGAKKKDRFFLDCTSISALRPPPPLGLSPFLHLFFLIFSKQLLHWKPNWSLQRLHSEWRIKDRDSECCWFGLHLSVVLVPALRYRCAPWWWRGWHAGSWGMGHTLVSLVPAAVPAAFIYY